MIEYIFNVQAKSKPRMTQSDKWSARKITADYWAYKSELVSLANKAGLTALPSEIHHINFRMEMPATWSKKKKLEMNGKLHTQRPDLDNLLKGLQDALCKEDSHIAQINGLSKRWSLLPSIEIEL